MRATEGHQTPALAGCHSDSSDTAEIQERHGRSLRGFISSSRKIRRPRQVDTHRVGVAARCRVLCSPNCS